MQNIQLFILKFSEYVNSIYVHICYNNITNDSKRKEYMTMKEELLNIIDTLTDNQILFVFTFLKRILGRG